MPFDEEDSDQDLAPSNKGLRKISSKKSIFDDIPKKPSQDEFEAKVKKVHDRSSNYKVQAADYSSQFKKIISDRTLVQNKNVFSTEIETELLSNMIKLAVEVNTDPNEQEGMGSLMWIILLLKTCLSQRDRINKLEYIVTQLEKKIEPATLEALITKEIRKTLDKPKNSE